jgi:hypothetical protein
MKSVKQLVAVLVWCAVSAGCVAEEVKQPVVSAVPALPIEAVTKEQNESSGDDGMTITTQVDPQTGQEYQELKSTFIIEKFNRDPSEHGYVVGINNIAIEYETAYGRRSPNAGHILYPEGLIVRNERYIEWNKLVGKQATLFCKIIDPFIQNNQFCFLTYGPSGCSPNGSTDFDFDYYCSLYGKSEYRLEFK